MKKEMLEYLEGYWTNGRDHDVIIEYINDFFSQYQPERLSEKNPKEYCGELPDFPRNLKSTQYPEG